MKLMKKSADVGLADRVNIDVTAPDDLRNGLGVYQRFRVDRAERRAKADAARGLAIYSAQVSGDIGRQAIEQKASLIKSTLVAQAVPALAAISTEMMARYQQAVLQMSAVRGEGFKQQLLLRHAMDSDMDQLAAQGVLTAEELAEAKQILHDCVATDVASLMAAMRRALDAIDAHAGRATDHIANQSPAAKAH